MYNNDSKHFAKQQNKTTCHTVSTQNNYQYHHKILEKIENEVSLQK